MAKREEGIYIFYGAYLCSRIRYNTAKPQLGVSILVFIRDNWFLILTAITIAVVFALGG